MKKITSLKTLSLLISLFCAVSLGFGQILTFEFYGYNGDNTSIGSNHNDQALTASTITRGAGLTPNINLHSFSSTNWAITNIDDAVANNQYVEFTITPSAGYEFGVTNISFKIIRSNNGLVAVALRSSLDGYASNIDVEKPLLDNTNTQVASFTVNQANKAIAVTYRLYGYAEKTGGVGRFQAPGTNNDVTVEGSVASIVPVSCIVSDNFTGATLGGQWTDVVGGNASVVSNELSIATNSGSNFDYIYQDVSSAYSTNLSTLSNPIAWEFNMQQSRVNPTGLNGTQYAAVFVLGATDSDLTQGNGYAVLLGTNASSTDYVRLVRYSGGLANANLTDIITGIAAGDIGNEHLSIRVTYNPSTNVWELFVRNDGAFFSSPISLGSANSQGTQTDTAFTSSNLNYIAAVWRHEATIGTDIATFDNLCISSRFACGSPVVTWTSTGWDNAPVGPSINTPVIIDYDYDTTNNNSFSACSLTVNTGFDLRVTNGHYVEVENDVVANGVITVETQGNFIQNNDLATFADNTGGLVVVEKEKAMQTWYSYTYWSSPTKTETIEGVLGNTPVDRRFRFEAANFIDNKTEIGNSNLFINGTPDDLDDDGNDWQPATGRMVPGVGYAATAFEFGLPYPRPPEKYNFYGEFNNGEIKVPLVSASVVYKNWNLVGNPYPCAISADKLFSVNPGLFDVIYLWDQGTPPSSSNGGGQNSNFSQDDYAMINRVGTVSGSRANTGIPPLRFVPSGQGFFIDANVATDLVFNNSMRAITNDNNQFFRSTNSKSKSSVANRLWINLTSDNGFFNQIMVGYVDDATNANDGEAFDAPRALTSVKNTTFYSIIENDNGKFAIQGKDVNSLDENEIIKLGFKSTINVATLFTLSVAQLEGDFLNNNTIFLKDKLLNKVHCLSTSDYTFTSAVGEFNDRFEIAFSNEALAVEDVILNKNALKIVQLENDVVQFTTTNNLNIKSVAIFDLLGRQLYQFTGNSNQETYKLSNLNTAVYIAKVTLSNGGVITKKAFKK